MNKLKEAGISWVIIGAVTKCPELPQPEKIWVEEIVRAADEAGVKVWLKASLYNALWGNDPIWAWSSRGTLRKEIPE